MHLDEEGIACLLYSLAPLGAAECSSDARRGQWMVLAAFMPLKRDGSGSQRQQGRDTRQQWWWKQSSRGPGLEDGSRRSPAPPERLSWVSQVGDTGGETLLENWPMTLPAGR